MDTDVFFWDSLSKVFLIIYTCMSETFLTYKSDVCLDCIVYYSLLFIFIILHKLVLCLDGIS